ncbi:MAG TPA: phosphatase PAP2 family protein [Amnibacterium sp.]
MPGRGSRGRWSTWHDRFVVEVRLVEPHVRRRLYAAAAALVAIGVLAFVLLLVAVLTHTGFERLDRPVEQWFDAQRSGDATRVMTVLAVVFGPIGMPILVLVVVVAWIVVARHVWRPVLLLAGMVTGVALAQVLAPIVRHPRPPLAQMLLDPDRTYSFPSGHVLGMSDFFLLLAFLFASRLGRRWFTVVAFTIAAVCIVAQVISRLYLGYHWLTDVTASVALSLVVVGVVIAIDTRRTVRVEGEQVTGSYSTRQTEGT